MGPVEYIAIEFPGSQFRGEILPALQDLVAKGTIRIIDLVVIKKEADGHIHTFEIDQLDANERQLFANLEGEIDDLLNDDDIHAVAQGLAPNSTAGLLVWENTWATQFTDAVRRAQGRVLAHDHVPNAVMQSAVEATPLLNMQHEQSEGEATL
jgi:uncharacterized membrane protein